MTPRAPAQAAAQANWLPRAAAMLFFIAALGLLALSLRPYIANLIQPETKSARGATYLLNLSRTPTIDAGRLSYAILGLGQDADSGRQVVWMRSLKTNRVAGFAEGEKVFGGPVRVEGISDMTVELAFRNEVRRIELAP